MAQERKVADVWAYNTCVKDGEPYVLLGLRKNYEKLFWHVASQGVFQEGDEYLSHHLLVTTAHIANKNELQLDTSKLPSGDVNLVLVDYSTNTTWKDNERGAHVWINHGTVDRLPPIIPTVYRTPVGSMKGLAHAEWVKAADLVVLPVDQRKTEVLDDDKLRWAASDRVFYLGLPLRSMVVSVLGGTILPRVVCSGEAYEATAALRSPYVTRFQERLPQARA